MATNFLSGPVPQNGKGFVAKAKQFIGNMFDRNNDGNRTLLETIKTTAGFFTPTGWATNLGRGALNQYRDYHPSQSQNDWVHSMPERPSMTSQFYGQPGDLSHQMNLPQYGLSNTGDMNYTGGSATFNEHTGQRAPQNGFLTGFNPSANQYRIMNMNQQRQDGIANYLNSANGANPFGHMNPGDRALANHTAHTQKMDQQRFAGDLNQSNAYQEYQDQNAARFKASQYSK